MTPFVETLDLSALGRNRDDAEKRFFVRKWRELSGVLPQARSGLDELSSKVLIFGKPQDEKTSPTLLCCGKNSFSNKVLGAGWGDSAKKAQEHLPDEYLELVTSAYYETDQNQTPMLQMVSSNLFDKTVRYERLLVPFETISGVRLIMCLSHEVEINPMKDLVSFDGYHFRHNPQNTQLLIPSHPDNHQTQAPSAQSL